jgi:uncharacterized membrane protein YcaP (DUF421 family)
MVSIFIRTIIIYIILNIMLRIMGKRQIGELEVNELVSTLLISEIGALPITDTNIPLLPSLFPILFIAALEVIVSVTKNKSATLKKAFEGEPVYIIYKGRLIQQALKENRISVNEFLTEMRIQGIADIQQIRYAILEQNGKISFLKESDSPNISTAIVIDCEPEINNLRSLGLDTIWLEKKLHEKGLTVSDVFLMCISENGDISVVEKEEK